MLDCCVKRVSKPSSDGTTSSARHTPRCAEVPQSCIASYREREREREREIGSRELISACGHREAVGARLQLSHDHAAHQVPGLRSRDGTRDPISRGTCGSCVCATSALVWVGRSVTVLSAVSCCSYRCGSVDVSAGAIASLAGATSLSGSARHEDDATRDPGYHHAAGTSLHRAFRVQSCD